MPQILRILDANANRGREALRVQEEAARFLLNDKALAGAFKALRHDLSHAAVSLGSLTAHRDTPGDVGTSLSTPAEHHRGSVADVAVAAGKRVTEALRCLEEYAKLLPSILPPTVSANPPTADFKAMRYRAYELERQLLAALRPGQPRQWRLCVLLSEQLCVHHPWQTVLEQVLDAGADCVQLREKTLEDAELLRRAQHLVAACHAAGASAILNDRVDLALLSEADGVHLGQTDLSPAASRRLAGNQLIVGQSTNNLAEAHAALAAGVDYVGLGPMYVSTTKAKAPAGPAYLQAFLADPALAALPHLAIGGITPDNLPDLIATGVRGIAVSSAVCGAADPGAAVRALLDQLPV